MDDTVGVARSLDQETEARFTSTSKQELAKDASLGRVIGSLEAALERENPLMGMEEIVSEVQNPLEQTILRELLGDLRGIESEVLTERERAVIFRESMEYLHDYQAAIAAGSFTKANPNAHDVFKLLQDNQRKLAHQTIVDRKFLTGSDHGVLHVIEADMRGAMVMADQLGGVLTPKPACFCIRRRSITIWGIRSTPSIQPIITFLKRKIIRCIPASARQILGRSLWSSISGRAYAISITRRCSITATSASRRSRSLCRKSAHLMPLIRRMKTIISHCRVNSSARFSRSPTARERRQTSK